MQTYADTYVNLSVQSKVITRGHIVVKPQPILLKIQLALGAAAGGRGREFLLCAVGDDAACLDKKARLKGLCDQFVR